MKQKLIILPTLFLILTGMVSCNQSKSIDEMVNDLKGDSITYVTDYMFYYYELDNPSKLIPIENNVYDVEAKVSNNAYSVKAYFKDTTSIASSSYLEKDSEGDVAYTHLSIKNEVVSEKALDGTGSSFKWENSVYYNFFNKLNIEDLTKKEDGNYSYTGDLNGLPLDLVHAAVPTSYFNMASCDLIVNENKIESILIKEIEDKEIWADQNSVYGRQLSISFMDVNNTVPNLVTPYSEDANNADLGLALEEMRSATSYEVKVDAYKDNEDETIFLSHTFITENDLLKEDSTYSSGFHTYQDKLHSFVETGDYLLGTELSSSESIGNYIPKFDFSKEVFEYQETDTNGNKIYAVRAGMEKVIDDINYESTYSGEYYNGAGRIYFYVKDGSLNKVEFPVFLVEGDKAVVYTQRVSYLNINNTIISNDKWSSFVTEIPSENDVLSWSDEKLKFDFDFAGEEEREMTPGDVFNYTLGNPTAVPFFLPKGLIYETSGNYSAIDECVYITLEANGVTTEQIEYIHSILLANGFEYEDFGDGYGGEFTRGKVAFGVFNFDGVLSIEFILPPGDILSLVL